jgi:hypothetical protein
VLRAFNEGLPGGGEAWVDAGPGSLPQPPDALIGIMRQRLRGQTFVAAFQAFGSAAARTRPFFCAASIAPRGNAAPRFKTRCGPKPKIAP